MKNLRVAAITAVPKALVAQGHVEPGEMPQQLRRRRRVESEGGLASYPVEIVIKE